MSGLVPTVVGVESGLVPTVVGVVSGLVPTVVVVVPGLTGVEVWEANAKLGEKRDTEIERVVEK